MSSLKKFFWILALILVMTGIYSFVSLQKHYHFQTFGWDTAVFDQQIYLLSHFKSPHTSLMKMNGLGDHFQLLTLALGAISYWIWESVKSIFVLQAFAGSLSVLPLYLISQILLRKTKLGENQITILSLLISTAYLLSVPFQSMLLDEFHNEPLILAPLIFIFYFLLKKNWLGYWLSFLLVILNKEMLGFIGLPLGLYVYLKTKNIKQSLLTIVVGVSTSLLLIFYFMPIISGTGKYVHFKSTNNPSQLINKFAAKPYLFITEMANTPEKKRTIYASLFSFGFLPLLAPTQLILPAFSLAIRFFDNTSTRLHAFNNHYAAPFLPLLAIAFVYGIYHLARWMESRKLLAKYWWGIGLYVLFFTLAQNYIFHGPLNSVFKPSFYKVAEWELDAHQLIDQVPPGATLATQNSLLPHLSARDSFYLLPELGEAEYLVVDLSDGPNKFSPLTQDSAKSLVMDLLNRGQYALIWQKNDSLLLKKTDYQKKYY